MTEKEMDEGVARLRDLADWSRHYEEWTRQLWALVEPRDRRILRKLWTMRPFDDDEHNLEVHYITDVVPSFPSHVWMEELFRVLPELIARNASYLLEHIFCKTLRHRVQLDPAAEVEALYRKSGRA